MKAGDAGNSLPPVMEGAKKPGLNRVNALSKPHFWRVEESFRKRMRHDVHLKPDKTNPYIMKTL